MGDNTKKIVVEGYIGIDNGTQGLTVIFTDTSLKVLATGEATYAFVSGLEDGCYEQRTQDWDDALMKAMCIIHDSILDKSKKDTNNDDEVVSSVDIKVLAIGISGQMHGEVLADENNEALCPVRLWCDARNESEGHELTDKLQFKIPKRSTCARFLWTIRNRPDIACKTKHITTPAGWIAYRLTGQWNLGIGDAAGMFPIDPHTYQYDKKLLDKYDTIVRACVGGDGDQMPFLGDILPCVKKAGEDAGHLNETGARLLGLSLAEGEQIPVASAEGDQVAALAGSLIGRPGMISCGFGTSVCANVVGDTGHEFHGVSPLVDHYCCCDGKPMLMVWLRNGTTFLNTVVESYGGMLTANSTSSSNNNDKNSGKKRKFDDDNNGDDKTNNGNNDDNKDNDIAGKNGGAGTSSSSKNPFAQIVPQVVDAPPDCGGLIALPFMDDEPGLGVSKGGSALIMGWSADNAKVGNVAKAALLSTVFNLRMGCDVLEEQKYPRIEIGLSGGLTKTSECGQIIADVFNTPVTLLLESADEGCAWGAAVMAKFRHRVSDFTDWTAYLDSVETGKKLRFEPSADAVKQYERSFQRYKQLIQLEPELTKVMTP